MASNFDGSTGIYTSGKPPVQLPLDPHLDIVSYVCSTRPLGCEEAAAAVALINGSTGESITQTQLRSSIQSLATKMQQDLGIQKGDVIMLLLPHTLLFPVIVNALLSLGAVAVMVNQAFSSHDIVAQITITSPKIIITDKAGMDKLSNGGLPLMVLVSHDQNNFNVVFSPPSISAGSELGIVKGSVQHTDPAAIIFTSGTTGASKGVVTSHGNLIAATTTILGEMEPEDVILVLYSMSGMPGLVWFCCSALFGKSRLVFLPKYDLAQAMAAVERHQVTKLVLNPAVAIDLLKDHTELSSRYDLSSLKTIMSASAPLAKKTMEAVMSKYPHVSSFLQLYGSTETTMLGTGGYGPRGSVGTLHPCMEAKVIDIETSKPLPPGKSGQLLLRGPSIMQGYYQNPVATAAAFDDEHGWLRTGDLVYFDTDGYLYIIDRIKQLIKCNFSESQIAPSEIEAILLVHPDIIDCGVIPFADDGGGEVPLACVVRRPQAQLTAEQVIDFVSSQVAPYKKVSKVVFVDSIPRAGGKIVSRELKRQVMQHQDP